MSQLYVDEIFGGTEAAPTFTSEINQLQLRDTGGNFPTQRSVHLGFEAGLNSTSTGSASLGTYALKDATGFRNTAIGAFTMQTVTGTQNTAVGYQAGASVTTGLNNVFVGDSSGQLVDSGSNNTCIGQIAGDKLTTGIQNVIIGYKAATGNNDPLNTSLITGNNNVLIGLNGYGFGDVSNKVVLGDGQTDGLFCSATTITFLSDERDKKDIKDMSVGLDLINDLRPVEFVWNDRNEEGKRDVKDSGFIAQELKAVEEKYNISEALKLTSELQEGEKMFASPGKLIPVLVKAIQELSARVEALEA